MAPVYLIIKLTVPVIDDEEESWNYPLTIIQSLAAPFMFYVLLEQYEEDEFGVDDNCGLDPTSDCDGFPRWAIPIIIGAFFCLSKSVKYAWVCVLSLFSISYHKQTETVVKDAIWIQKHFFTVHVRSNHGPWFFNSIFVVTHC